MMKATLLETVMEKHLTNAKSFVPLTQIVTHSRLLRIMELVTKKTNVLHQMNKQKLLVDI